jgi:hypothetical protein
MLEDRTTFHDLLRERADLLPELGPRDGSFLAPHSRMLRAYNAIRVHISINSDQYQKYG